VVARVAADRVVVGRDLEIGGEALPVSGLLASPEAKLPQPSIWLGQLHFTARVGDFARSFEVSD
jgi:hypothetical protein